MLFSKSALFSWLRHCTCQVIVVLLNRYAPARINFDPRVDKTLREKFKTNGWVKFIIRKSNLIHIEACITARSILSREDLTQILIRQNWSELSQFFF